MVDVTIEVTLTSIEYTDAKIYYVHKAITKNPVS